MIRFFFFKINGMSKPIFIVIEGIDGSGKTTQIELLQQRMSEEGKPVAITSEPTDGFIGRIIRDIMRGTETTDPAAVAALYVADRMDHITHPEVGMLALMEKGYNIIASRYYFSSYAFQGEYVSLEWLIHANSICKSRLTADLTIYINIDPEICFERIKNSRASLDIYENLEKMKRTHREYMKAFDIAGMDENIVLVDGTLPIRQLHEAIWAKVKEVTF